MKLDPTINQQLNAVLKESLTQINQLFLHARMLGNWGFHQLEEREYKASIRAMKHADALIARILFLEGLPNLQDLGKLMIGEQAPEILEHDLTMERRYRDALVTAITHCEQQRDFVTRHHLEELQEDSEERIDWLETQSSLIAALGIENYLQSAV
ncbi:bacterioferritin [Thiorhodococcus drewsii AZ1]|uniref:Bacterioferritin n=1 Tax=Thiorhodococcus drewsii AZ1 TaxID=765913 RepID=G2DY35_9GAMM|nr:bacterioferritin [Thiorhodococcus drewsii]EGV32827.1 bacterioferritin [Thiorhodococcus drewsii AZ1]